MKVKHIITTACGVIAGGLMVAQGASAVVTYAGKSDVQFTFVPTLSVGLSGDFTITDLAPGTSDNSNEVTVTVNTNSVSGYTLSATVGDTTSATYNTTDLVGDNGNVFSMIGTSATTLSNGTWGYTLDGTTYDELDTTTAKTLASTSTSSGTATTRIRIGAKAASTQMPDTYRNVINFTAVSNVSTRYVTVVAGDNVDSVTPASPAYYVAGDSVSLTATCDSGYTFGGWTVSPNYGLIADPTVASTTYTVGAGDVTLTATCAN